MKRKSKKAAIKKYPLGGALVNAGTSLLGLVTGAIGSNRAEEEAEEARKLQELLVKQKNRKADALSLANFKPEGEGFVDYYMKDGGKLANPSYMTKGGDLKPLSSDMELAKGNKHGESKIDNTSGIKLQDSQGNSIAEVEDEETIKDGAKVYSDTLVSSSGKTYAQEAEMLAKKKGKLEEKLSDTTDPISKNTITRQIEAIDLKEEKLFLEQEATKPTEEQPQVYEDGGNLDKIRSNIKKKKLAHNIGKGVNLLTPFIDNIGNAIMTANTPKIAPAVVQDPIRFDTKVNVNPQLNDVSKAVGAAEENIKSNTANSNIARNEMANVRLKGGEAKAKIRADKENKETQLRNAAASANANISARNIANVNNNNLAQTQRAVGIQGRTSANLTDLADDFIESRNFKAKQAYDKERLDIARSMYNAGTTRRAILNNPTDIEKAQIDNDYANELLAGFRGTPEEAALRELLGIPMSSPASSLQAKSYNTTGYAKIN